MVEVETRGLVQDPALPIIIDVTDPDQKIGISLLELIKTKRNPRKRLRIWKMPMMKL
jgi:hypothetical protein